MDRDNVISERINNSSLKSIQDFFKNPIAIWDNFYANDYCPSRLFLGPLKGRSLNKSIVGHFLNGTGLKETDKFLLNYLFNPKQKVPYLPKELKPIFSDPFKKLNEKELQRALNISKKSIRFIFENPLDEILLEWKPFLMSSLNDIKLFHLESKKEVEGFLERRYSPLFVKGLTKKGEIMLGNMMNEQLLISGVLEHAIKNNANTEIVSNTVEGGIHRYTIKDSQKDQRNWPMLCLI